MKKFYFTYGSEGHPYVGGWTIIIAECAHQARELFRLVHPCVMPNILNCSFVYSEQAFVRTKMYKNGNMGHGCWETIELNITR